MEVTSLVVNCFFFFDRIHVSSIFVSFYSTNFAIDLICKIILNLVEIYEGMLSLTSGIRADLDVVMSIESLSTEQRRRCSHGGIYTWLSFQTSGVLKRNLERDDY